MPLWVTGHAFSDADACRLSTLKKYWSQPWWCRLLLFLRSRPKFDLAKTCERLDLSIFKPKWQITLNVSNVKLNLDPKIGLHVAHLLQFALLYGLPNYRPIVIFLFISLVTLFVICQLSPGNLDRLLLRPCAIYAYFVSSALIGGRKSLIPLNHQCFRFGFKGIPLLTSNEFKRCISGTLLTIIF